MKKVLVYSHDAFGLGNSKRMLEIITHLASSSPDVTVLLITGSAMIQAFRIPPRVDYIKLPCVGRSVNGEPVVRHLELSYADTIQLRADVIKVAALDFAPDLVLVDKKPFGIANELRPVLSALRARAGATRVVLLLRDILDAPPATIREWRSGGYHGIIHQYYDAVLIAGDRAIFDVAREYRFPAGTSRKLRYCGYIGRPLPSIPPDQVRSELAVGDAPLVLVTAGGGADGGAMMMAYLKGLSTRRQGGIKTLLVTGPDLPPSSGDAVRALVSRNPDVILREFYAEMISAINAADLVVSMCGYNTACELLSLRKRAIVVPRVTPVLEQWIRAERLQESGLLRVLHPKELTPRLLIDAVTAELFRSSPDLPQRYPSLDGLPQIRAALLDLLKTKTRMISHAAPETAPPPSRNGKGNPRSTPPTWRRGRRAHNPPRRHP